MKHRKLKRAGKQAASIAQERMNKISHHMYLEAQELTKHHSKEAFESMVVGILASAISISPWRFSSSVMKLTVGIG